MHDQPQATAPAFPAFRLRLLRATQGLLSWLTIFYLAGLQGLLLAIVYLGERHPALNLCLFLPPLLWLLPLGFLVPASLLFRPVLCLWHLAGALFVLGPFMSFQWGRVSEPELADLVCISNNIATNHGYSLKPFVIREDADIIALQDATGDGDDVVREFPERHSATSGQFVLISRYPIVKSEPIKLAPFPNDEVAARSEVLFRDQPIAIYNVRLPSPRRDLTLARVFLGMLRRNPTRINETAHWDAYAAALPQRLELTRNLLARLQEERLPAIVLGDFNTPSRGYTYRLLSRTFTDCFTASGRGYGFTFPGNTRFPISVLGPWLRLDYVFADRHWQPVSCRVDDSRRAEHHAIAARLRFSPEKKNGEKR